MYTEDERTTFAGSHMLDELKAELAGQTEMLSSQDSDGDPKNITNQFPQNLLESNFDEEEDSWFRGTSFFHGFGKSDAKTQVKAGHRSGMVFSSMEHEQSQLGNKLTSSNRLSRF